MDEVRASCDPANVAAGEHSWWAAGYLTAINHIREQYELPWINYKGEVCDVVAIRRPAKVITDVDKL